MNTEIIKSYKLHSAVLISYSQLSNCLEDKEVRVCMQLGNERLLGKQFHVITYLQII